MNSTSVLHCIKLYEVAIHSFKLGRKLPADQTGRRRHYVLGLSVRPSVCYQTREHGILKATERILMQNHVSGPRSKVMKRSTLSVSRSKVKDQGHARPEIDLETWHRCHSGPVGPRSCYSTQRVANDASASSSSFSIVFITFLFVV